jgi:hypothetical protein
MPKCYEGKKKVVWVELLSRIWSISGDGSRRWLRRNGKEWIRLCKEDFMCDLKLQWDCYKSVTRTYRQHIQAGRGAYPPSCLLQAPIRSLQRYVCEVGSIDSLLVSRLITHINFPPLPLHTFFDCWLRTSRTLPFIALVFSCNFIYLHFRSLFYEITVSLHEFTTAQCGLTILHYLTHINQHLKFSYSCVCYS